MNGTKPYCIQHQSNRCAKHGVLLTVSERFNARNIMSKTKRYSRKENNGDFYRSRAWRQLQKQKRAANPLCERCEANGLITPMQEVHHIIPIDDDWSLRFEWSNLMSVCYLCHKQLTAEYHKQQRYAQNNPGKQYGTDKQHSLSDFDIPLE